MRGQFVQIHLEASDSRELDEGLRRIAQVIATLRRSGSSSTERDGNFRKFC